MIENKLNKGGNMRWGTVLLLGVLFGIGLYGWLYIAVLAPLEAQNYANQVENEYQQRLIDKELGR